jgi:predicted DCC family thiol-disulfide oxidoreductase YuxK
MPTPRAIILFDGVCNLCNGAVRFIIERDPHAQFAFAPLQSAAARALLEKHGAPTPLPDSMVLIEGGRVYVRSAAVLRIARGLGFPWRLAYALAAVPRPLRDWAYRLIARSRYRWFGKSESCMVPTPELRARFLS